VRVAIVGQGYVSLPVAMRAVDAGHDVVGFDVDADRIELLRKGTSFIADVPSARLRGALDTDRYRATYAAEDCAGFDIAVISVPTPLTDGAPDLSFVERAAELLAPHVRPGCTVVLESTTYPGTTEELVRPVLEKVRGSTQRSTSTSATAPSASIPATNAGLSRTCRRSCRV
jgi:nucleotide sugar dehydrogenase